MESTFKKVKRIPKVRLSLDCIQVILEKMTCFKTAINLARTSKKIWERFTTCNLFYKKWKQRRSHKYDGIKYLVQYGCLCCVKKYTTYTRQKGYHFFRRAIIQCCKKGHHDIVKNLDIFEFFVINMLRGRYGVDMTYILTFVSTYKQTPVYLIEYLFFLHRSKTYYYSNTLLKLNIIVETGNLKALKHILSLIAYTTEDIIHLKRWAEKHNQKEITNYLKNK